MFQFSHFEETRIVADAAEEPHRCSISNTNSNNDNSSHLHSSQQPTATSGALTTASSSGNLGCGYCGGCSSTSSEAAAAAAFFSHACRASLSRTGGGGAGASMLLNATRTNTAFDDDDDDNDNFGTSDFLNHRNDGHEQGSVAFGCRDSQNLDDDLRSDYDYNDAEREFAELDLFVKNLAQLDNVVAAAAQLQRESASSIIVEHDAVLLDESFASTTDAVFAAVQQQAMEQLQQHQQREEQQQVPEPELKQEPTLPQQTTQQQPQQSQQQQPRRSSATNATLFIRDAQALVEVLRVDNNNGTDESRSDESDPGAMSRVMLEAFQFGSQQDVLSAAANSSTTGEARRAAEATETLFVRILCNGNGNTSNNNGMNHAANSMDDGGDSEFNDWNPFDHRGQAEYVGRLIWSDFARLREVINSHPEWGRLIVHAAPPQHESDGRSGSVAAMLHDPQIIAATQERNQDEENEEQTNQQQQQPQMDELQDSRRLSLTTFVGIDDLQQDEMDAF